MIKLGCLFFFWFCLFILVKYELDFPKFVWKWLRKNKGTFDHVMCSCWKTTLGTHGKHHRAMANTMVLKVWSDVARGRGEHHKPMANATGLELAFSMFFFFSPIFLHFLSFLYFFLTREFCIDKYLKQDNNTSIIQ